MASKTLDKTDLPSPPPKLHIHKSHAEKLIQGKCSVPKKKEGRIRLSQTMKVKTSLQLNKESTFGATCSKEKYIYLTDLLSGLNNDNKLLKNVQEEANKSSNRLTKNMSSVVEDYIRNTYSGTVGRSTMKVTRKEVVDFSPFIKQTRKSKSTSSVRRLTKSFAH